MNKSGTRILFIFFMTICLLSCNRKSNDIEVTLNMEEVIHNSKEFKLSEIAEKIEYVKLETNEDALITNSSRARVLSADGYLLIGQHGRPLLAFDDAGKYLRSIGTIGRGPGEYNSDYEFAFDNENQKIYIFDITKKAIHCFDIQGKYLKDIKIKESIIAFDYIGNDFFCGCLPSIVKNESSMYNYVIFDNKGEIKKKHFIPGKATSTSPGPKPGTFFARVLPPRFVKSPSGVNIITHQNDSIFTIKMDGSLEISFSWNLGKYDPEYDFLDHESEEPDNDKFIDVFMPIESGKYWFVYFNKDGKPHRAIYNKRLNNYNEIMPLGKALINDIDGGPAFWPNYNCSEDNTFVTLFDPIRLKNSMNKGDFNNTKIKYPEKNRKLLDLITSVSENDNPIARIVYTK